MRVLVLVLGENQGLASKADIIVALLLLLCFMVFLLPNLNLKGMEDDWLLGWSIDLIYQVQIQIKGQGRRGNLVPIQ